MKIFFKNIRAANDEQITKATSNEHEKKKKKWKKLIFRHLILYRVNSWTWVIVFQARA